MELELALLCLNLSMSTFLSLFFWKRFISCKIIYSVEEADFTKFILKLGDLFQGLIVIIWIVNYTLCILECSVAYFNKV